MRRPISRSASSGFSSGCELYEEHTIPMPAVSDAAMLRHLIEARRITQAKLAQETGIAMSTISNVLNGRRTLTRSHIGTLATFFSVSPAVFLATTAGFGGNFGKRSSFRERRTEAYAFLITGGG